jgi:hypothetical protein
LFALGGVALGPGLKEITTGPIDRGITGPDAKVAARLVGEDFMRLVGSLP